MTPIVSGRTQVQTCWLRGCVQDVARRAEIQNQATLGCWQESPSCPSSWSFPLAPRSAAWSFRVPTLPSCICLPIQSQRLPLQYPSRHHTVSKAHSRCLINITERREWVQSPLKVLNLIYLFWGAWSLAMSKIELFPQGPFLLQHSLHITPQPSVHTEAKTASP